MRTFKQIERDIREAEGILNAANLADSYDDKGNLTMTVGQRRVSYRARLMSLRAELAALRAVFPNSN